MWNIKKNNISIKIAKQYFISNIIDKMITELPLSSITQEEKNEKIYKLIEFKEIVKESSYIIEDLMSFINNNNMAKIISLDDIIKRIK